jgi:sodium/bile acid cotransporter 7
VPVLGWAGGRLLPHPDLRVGLLICASVPCTLASAVLWTRLAGGNEAVALLVVLLTTGLSWLVTTAWLALGTGTEVAVDTPAMMQGLVLVVLVPVALGQLGRAVPALARAADRQRVLLGVVSRLLIVSIVFKAAVDVGEKLGGRFASLPPGGLLGAAGLCLGIHLIALTTGFWSSGWLGCGRASRIAVAFACSQKTLPVSLYLFEAYFKDAHPLAVVPLVCYHFGQLLVDTFIADGLAGRGRAGAGKHAGVGHEPG